MSELKPMANALQSDQPTGDKKMKIKIISISKRQFRKIRNGLTVLISRNGSKLMLRLKSKRATAEARILAKIDKLKSKLALMKNSYECHICDHRKFISRQALAVHNTRMHKK